MRNVVFDGIKDDKIIFHP